MHLPGLRLFNPRVNGNNRIPTVNMGVQGKVLPYAPDLKLGTDFYAFEMNLVDLILNNIGKPADDLGPTWSPLERVVHNFHMLDLWKRIHSTAYQTVLAHPPTDEQCACLMDIENNGVRAAVGWIADHYQSGTPITLLNRPIPKLADAESWQVWRVRLLHYYSEQALLDAASFIFCAVRDF